ncbi:MULTISPECIES: AraC family transcriptional regulator [Chryseobacterium]|uniref:AraC-like DNA-binding protein n=1 Tax=Chryseobacterium camelliae TaxID=1265445 RepID=A0ABU0TIP0_9FLAO|nr:MULTISPECIES: helix-turn-helix domain-containing protein [Chryseobacterium]MDT3409209.1 AraC-like DNA-binding protein [Pseudacidovorax intermedius]MDQ1096930.1 AraC-like DNA-binding protein [Chryseobacterium camelliae]MDQ1100872.1 AraC-like DNA-binding protein [Chryseobacterium sp. SORGH_AS_1048]MDR6084314.1 AraC-like DNA-binding protein [Chryseobacterium sp. SORGH_AS_0909]MDR6132585.1 AraC-like DNA-binding protein [Chryseobacterium sp. SORGH_AS_1175]
MEQIHDTFAIEIAEYDEWQHRSRKNNFFELAYILDGKGFHSVNYVDYPYKENGIFLLPTAKCHQYIIKETTTFLFVRFTGNYFASNTNNQVDYSCWFNRLNFIMGNHNHLSGELIEDDDDKKQLKRLLDVILYEYSRKDICSSFIIQNTLVSVLAVICRNIQQRNWDGRTFNDEKFVDLLNFISFNILDAEKLSVKYLSQKFHISETYFSEYFKRNASERFQDYVLKSKLRIAQSRAKFSDTPIQEIALELGFTDSSHLNRIMKNHFGKGMREIRKEMQG